MSTAVNRHRPVHAAGKPSGKKYGLSDSVSRFWSRRGVKPVAWTFAVLVWIPFLFILLMVLGINPIFTLEVSRLGSKALQVPVKLRRASVSFSGKLSLGRFDIQNPQGFSQAAAASFEGLYAEVPVRSLLAPEIDIPVLSVVRPVFNLEMGGKKQPSNWAVLMKNLSQSLPKKGESEPPGGEKRFLIHDLKIISPIVRYRSSTFPDGIDLDLKDVELKKIGNAPGSSSKTYMILASIFQAILTGGIKDKRLPSDVRGTLKEELREAGKVFGDVFEEVK